MSDSHAFVRGLYAAFAAGDVSALLANFAPGIVWNEAEGFPYSDGNSYVGGDAVVTRVFARIPEDWSEFRVEVKEIVGGPDVVTMFGRYRATHATTGKPLDAQCAHTWWIEGGKVVRFQQMVDTLAVSVASK
jgi:ketosteroid isomerase-like protein